MAYLINVNEHCFSWHSTLVLIFHQKYSQYFITLIVPIWPI